MKKTVIFMMFFSIIVKLVGIIKDLILASYYGTTSITDAYLISISIPETVFAFIGAAIVTIFIPMYSEIEKNEGRVVANRFLSNLLNISIIINTILVSIFLLFPKGIIYLFASGFSQDVLELSIELTNITIFGIYFTSIFYLFNAYLQYKNKFYSGIIVNLPYNIIIILSIIISVKNGVKTLAIGIVLASFIQLSILIISVYTSKYKYEFIINFNDKNLKKILKLCLPVVAGVCIAQLNVLVDKNVASRVGTGAISILTYSNRINVLIQAIVISTIVTNCYPKICSLISLKKFDEINIVIQNNLNYMMLIVIPVVIGIITLAQPIVELLFGRGQFLESDILLTTKTLVAYSIGLIAISIREILARVFCAFQDTKTPMFNAIITLILNIVLNIILSKYFGVVGLAIATSIANTVGSILLLFSVKNRFNIEYLRNNSKYLFKVCMSSAIMSICSLSIYYLSVNYLGKFALIIAILGGVIVYFLFSYLIKIKEVLIIKRCLENFINKKIKE